MQPPAPSRNQEVVAGVQWGVFRQLLWASALVGLIPLSFHVRQRNANTTWHLQPPSPGVIETFEERLPALVLAMDSESGKYDPALLDMVLLPPDVDGPLLSQLGELNTLLKGNPDRKTANMWSAAANHRASRQGWPYFVDIHLEPNEGQNAAWVRAWKIDAVHAVSANGIRRHALWVRRLGDVADEEDALGMKKGGQPWALVLVDEVEHHLERTLWPAVSDDRSVPLRPYYRKLSRELRDDLRAIVTPIPGAEPALQCGTRIHSDAICEQQWLLARPALVELLADVVQTHEIHHAFREKPPVPATLAHRMLGYPPERIQVAASELAATLAEMALGQLPRLSLVQALSVPKSKRKEPVGFVADVLQDSLAGVDLSLEQVLRLPPAALAQRAERTYEALFDLPIPRPLPDP